MTGINDLNSIRVLSALILGVMMGQYAAVSWLAYRRIRNGANGATLAVMVNSIALAVLSAAIAAYIVLPLPEGLVMLALFGVMGTNVYLIFSLQIEAARPLKRQTATMEQIHRRLK